METSEETFFHIRKRITRLIRQICGKPKFSVINTYVDNNNNQDNGSHIIINMNNNNIVQNNNDNSFNIYHKISNDVEFSPFEKQEPKSQEPSNEKSTIDQESSETDDKLNFRHSQAITLLTFFLIYVLVGACIMPFYEPDMLFFKAIYFNFVSLTSIGLGDIVPQSESYMALTLLYIAVGLAITTIAIEIAADYLKKLHYFGRKIENVGNVVIWFGGKKLTMKQLVKNLGDQFNLPVHAVKTLDLDKFVDDAIKVEEGEIETLRAPPIEPKDLLEDGTLNYADDEEGNWIRQRSPSTSTELEKEPMFLQEYENYQELEPEREIKEDSSNDPEVSENPENEVEKEIEDIADISVLYNKETLTSEPIVNKCDDDESFNSENPERRKSNYSEEAWRRYLEYQKQWRKYRQTKTTLSGNIIPTEIQYSKSRGTKEGSPKIIGASTSKQEVRVPMASFIFLLYNPCLQENLYPKQRNKLRRENNPWQL
uniref:Ion_trans_2 domain-containing protein n=1 Tax=Meloidogyne hapla TaxID=6305 RepID=A0A1I8BP65_MELHA